MSHIQRNSRFRRLSRRKPIEQENHIQSIGDTPVVHDFLIEQYFPRIINSNDYLHMIYLILIIIFYIYYMKILLENQTNLNKDYYYYQRELSCLLWFKKEYESH